MDAGAEYVNIADSAGYMTPDDVRARISLLVEKLPIPVGFHAHNNLGLAVANALTAAECGADYIDVTCRGLARAPGMPRQRWWPGYSSGWATRPAWTSDSDTDLAENVVEPIMQRPQIIKSAPLMEIMRRQRTGHTRWCAEDLPMAISVQARQTRHGRRPGGHDYRRGPCPLSGENRVLNLSKGQWQNRIEKGETSI